MMFFSRLLPEFNRIKGIFLQCLTASPYDRYLSTLCDSASSSTLLNLQSSCALSLNSAAKGIPKAAPGNVDVIVDLLTAHGLTITQITNILSLRPKLLHSDAEKTIKPNLELFASLNISGPELAKLATKVPRVLTIRASKVVELLREYELTNEEISYFTKKQPYVYLLKHDTNLREKLEYFKASGFTNLQVRKLVSSRPNVLCYSLQRRIKPAITLLRHHLGEDAKLLKVKNLYQSIWSSPRALKRIIEGKKELLQGHGIPSVLIRRLFLDESTMFSGEEKLKRVFEQARELDVSPRSPKIVEFIRVMVSLCNDSLERKKTVYRSFGLSEDDVNAVIRLQPLCIRLSEEKIRENLGFFIGRLKMSPLFIRKYPCAVKMSMTNRILPRCSVMEILVKKGLSTALKLGSLMSYSEKMFAKCIIDKHKSDVPQIVSAFKGHIPFNEFPDWYKLF